MCPQLVTKLLNCMYTLKIKTVKKKKEEEGKDFENAGMEKHL